MIGPPPNAGGEDFGDRPIRSARVHAEAFERSAEPEDEAALLAAKEHVEAQRIAAPGPIWHGIFRSIYFFDPNGHRVALACNIGTAEQYDELKRVASLMLEE